MDIHDEILRLDKFDKLVLINRIIQLESELSNEDSDIQTVLKENRRLNLEIKGLRAYK